jgi:rSAM/selenodomain-associated transferase 1
MSLRIVVFVRYPEPGRTKTRLIPAIGAEKAAALHRFLAERVLSVIREWSGRRTVSVEIRYEGADETRMREWMGSGLVYNVQRGSDIGERMQNAFEDAFNEKFNQVIIVGTDLPFLDSEILESALNLLNTRDLVLGPATDGGYYLIGLKAPVPLLFRDISWGTDRVLDRTVHAASSLGMTIAFARALDDVDRPEDLQKLALLPEFARNPALEGLL